MCNMESKGRFYKLALMGFCSKIEQNPIKANL